VGVEAEVDHRYSIEIGSQAASALVLFYGYRANASEQGPFCLGYGRFIRVCLGKRTHDFLEKIPNARRPKMAVIQGFICAIPIWNNSVLHIASMPAE
jgi:hypothetical protein